MSTHEEEPPIRLHAVPARETAESVLPGLPRVGALDALLREVDSLRLSLETDLTRAADAVEAGAVAHARDIIDSDLDGLRAFERRSLGHLADLAAEPLERTHPRWWTRIPAAPFVAAAALVGFLVAMPHPMGAGSGGISANAVSASESLNQITRLAASGQTSQVRDAATELHNTLEALVAQANSDPEAARQGLLLLSAERDVINQSGDSAALRDVLAESRHLSNLIFQALPVAVRAAKPSLAPVPVTVPTTQPTTRPASTPSPSAKPTTKPSSSPTAKPTTSPSARPSSSPSPGGPVLPGADGSIGG